MVKIHEINVMEEAQKRFTLTIKLKGMTRFKIRLKIMIFLFWLIKIISPMPVVVEEIKE